MTENGEPTVKVTCPCCAATLTVDVRSGAVEEWKQAQDPRKGAALKDAEKLLREEKERVASRYEEIVRTEKGKGAAMDRKFQEFLEKSQGEPAARPLRDIDLD
ncbi:MAG: hypothetical protein ACM31I_08835 [Deltaproteobacteria bacterium]